VGCIHMFYDGQTDSCHCVPYADTEIPSRCTSCGTCRGRKFDGSDERGVGCGCIAEKCKHKCDAPGCPAVAEQRRIWKQSRAAESSYLGVLSSLTVPGGLRNRPKNRFAMVNWNQMSDRAVPSIGTAYIPTHGSTTRGSSVTHRPGCGGFAGVGVDVKHGSYARYLARLKAPNLRTERATCAEGKAGRAPRTGNKRRMVGMLSWATRAKCC